MYAINEKRPGARWQSLFRAVWPGYRSWYLSEGASARPALKVAEGKLRRYLPELVPTWERLVSLTGDDELAARMLTLWNPPKFLPGCSQVALAKPAPALLRNYDYAPELFEQVVYSSQYANRRVIGTSDCLWGLLDGMNDDGLAVSLAFGGRPGVGDGFAAPLVVRYLLEVATSVEEAKQALLGLPISMTYNLTMVDIDGEVVTAYVGPDAAPEFFAQPVATNHRGRRAEHPAHAQRFRSVERQDALTSVLERGGGVEEVSAALLGPAVFSDDYDGAFGTLYTAVYRPDRGEVEYRWPDKRWIRTFDSVEETTTVSLTEGPDALPREVDGDHVDVVDRADPPIESPGSVDRLTETARDAVHQLSRTADPAAFAALLGLSAEVGEALGANARLLAEYNSWAHVAEIADVSRQAAWHRWR